MMAVSLSRTRRVVGIDIGESSIKAAQVERAHKETRLAGAFRIARDPGSDALTEIEAGRLARTMARRKFDADDLVLIAPAQHLVSGGVELPSLKERDAQGRIVEMELNRAYRLPMRGFEYNWWELPPGHQSRVTSAHAVALPHRAIEPTLEALQGVGVEVDRTVPASLAVATAAQRYPIDARRITATVDFGLRSARLSLMHAGQVVHERGLPDFNAKTIMERVESGLAISEPLTAHAMGTYGMRDQPEGLVECGLASALSEPIEHLCEEIGMSFAYVSHHYPQAELGPVFLTGGPANIPGLSSTMMRRLELDVAVISPSSLMACDCFGSEVTDPGLTAVVGAALMAGGGYGTD